MMIAYIIIIGDMGQINYVPLVATGRWKIKTCAYYKNKLYIEHKVFWKFTQWIDEGKIALLPENKEFINRCN